MQIERGFLDPTEQLYWDAFLETSPTDSQFWLACHAALPVALTSDLLYKIWLNFREPRKGNEVLLDILNDVSDLLHSSLCREIGRDLYEIHQGLRSSLLDALQKNARFGPSRILALAQFLKDYLLFNPDKSPNSAFREAQRITALSYLNPDEVAKLILDLAISEDPNHNKIFEVDYLLRLTKQRNVLTNAQHGKGDVLMIAEQLVEGFRAFNAGDLTNAVDKFRSIEPFIDEVGGNGFKTKIPEGVWLALRGNSTPPSQSELALQIIRKENSERTGILDLGNCGLKTIPGEVLEMSWLEVLNLGNTYYQWDEKAKIYTKVQTKNFGPFNSLAELPTQINQLKELVNLTISGKKDNIWEIRDLSQLGTMTNLQILSLDYTKVSDLSSLNNLVNLDLLSIANTETVELSPLFNLKNLNISGTQITDIEILNKFKNLEELNISNNNISNIDPISSLFNLKKLDLSRTKINNLIPLAKLVNLQKLELSYTLISSLAPIVSLFRKQLLECYAEGCSIKEVPSELLEGNEHFNLAVYFQEKEEGTSPLHEAKLILLGDGRSGKTSLVNRLFGKELPRETDRTLGVDVITGEYAFPLPEGGEFRLHIWDFNGQDKYKHLHQFYYTEDAIYLFVLDSGNPSTDYDDWFQTVQLFGAESPLLIVINEFREGNGYGTFDIEHWQKRYPRLIKEHFLVNLSNGKNFDQLKNAIQFYAKSLPHAQVEYPKTWILIRQKLERLRDENFISFSEYLKICQENGLPEIENALILSSLLHKIGVCLHYQQNELLRQYLILKNEWVTEALYKIIDDEKVVHKKGFFDTNDLIRIWSEVIYTGMRPQLLELMQEFKMAYPLPNNDEYVMPILLPLAPPSGWEFPKEESLELFVEYDFLPKGLLNQFIVSRHADINEGRTLVWRNGVVLRWPDALAEVVTTKFQGRDAFAIRGQGTNRKLLLTAIIKSIRDLHSIYKGIKVSEIIPCPCSGCSGGKNKQHYFDFQNIINRIEKGRNLIECDKSLEEVELLSLINNMFVFEALSIGQPVVLKNIIAYEPPLAYISFAYEDSVYLEEMYAHFQPLERSKKIRLWSSSRDIHPGEETVYVIKKNLNAADIIFLLISSNFLASPHIWNVELKEALRRYHNGEVTIIPIILRPCAWQEIPYINKLQCFPNKEYGTISKAPDRDEAWVDIINQIIPISSESVQGNFEIEPPDVNISLTESSPLRAFFAYSIRDISYFESFLEYLRPFEWNGKINLLHDSKSPYIEQWDSKIIQNLNTSDVIFLLLSADFLASISKWELDLIKAIQRHETGEVTIIPIILRPCAWRELPFFKTFNSFLDENDKAISVSIDYDQAWVDIINQIIPILSKTRQDSFQIGPPEVDLFTPESPPQSIFAYSEKDFSDVEPFIEHLRPFERSGKISLVNGSPIEQWESKITKSIDSADIIFLMLSADFLNNLDSRNWEYWEYVINRYEMGLIKIMPIALRPCDWKGFPGLNNLKIFPINGGIISHAKDIDSIWLTVISEIFIDISSNYRSKMTESETTNAQPQTITQNGFISYSRVDSLYLENLKLHLTHLERSNRIRINSPVPVENWDNAVHEALKTADIIIILISISFINNEEIWGKEITDVIMRHKRDEAKVIPILIRECFWQNMPFSDLNILPNKSKPVSKYENQDLAWVEVVKEIENQLKK